MFKKKIKKLNLGCGKDHKKDFINLDYNDLYNPDVVHNLDKIPYPFKDSEFDYIYCSHILEHVEDLFKTLKEIERILKPEGILHVKVPHFSNGKGYSDITHKRFFGWTTFNKILSCDYINIKFNFVLVSQKYNFLSLNYPRMNKVVNWIILKIITHSIYERFLCWIIPAGEIELKLRKQNE